MKKIILPSIAIFSMFLVSCKKDDVSVAPTNIALMDKSPDQIRSAVAGDWQVQRESQFTFWDGGSGTDDKTWLHNTGHIVRFLADDSVQMYSYDKSRIFAWDKANLQNISNPIPDNVTPNVTAYFIANGNRWVVKEIRNDTLVFYDVYPEHIIVTYYATRKK